MKSKAAKLMSNIWVWKIIILAAIIAFMAVMEPKFFQMSNVRSIVLAVSIYGIMSFGMLIVIIVGGIDLCLGSEAAIGAVIFTMMYVNMGETVLAFILSGLAALAICALIGLLHGLLVTKAHLQPFVVTLATKSLLGGLALMLTQGGFILPSVGGLFWKISNTKIIGIPMPIIWFFITCIVATFVISHTSFGRRCYFVGGNRRAGQIVGINSHKYMIISYIICAIMACLGGFVLASLNMQVSNTTASGYEGKVLTAMIVGGVSMDGGGGGVANVIFGALFVGIINNVLILLNVTSDYQMFVQGVVIVVAIAINVLGQSQGMKVLNRLAGKARETVSEQGGKAQ